VKRATEAGTKADGKNVFEMASFRELISKVWFFLLYCRCFWRFFETLPTGFGDQTHFLPSSFSATVRSDNPCRIDRPRIQNWMHPSDTRRRRGERYELVGRAVSRSSRNAPLVVKHTRFVGICWHSLVSCRSGKMINVLRRPPGEKGRSRGFTIEEIASGEKWNPSRK